MFRGQAKPFNFSFFWGLVRFLAGASIKPLKKAGKITLLSLTV